MAGIARRGLRTTMIFGFSLAVETFADDVEFVAIGSDSRERNFVPALRKQLLCSAEFMDKR